MFIIFSFAKNIMNGGDFLLKKNQLNFRTKILVSIVPPFLKHI